eukprot:jgi/Tetstr1/430431/TSEL_020241.t1
MESLILFLAAKFDFCADDIEEWVHTLRELREKRWEESRHFDKFWHEDVEKLQYWLRNRPPCPARGATADTGTAAQPEAGPAARNARNAVDLPHNAEVAVGRKTNDDSIKQFFDAGQGSLVIMDISEHHENITKAERLDLLGDWEATRSVGKILKHKDLKDPDERKRQLKLVSYEPWVPDRSGNPEIPLWLAVDLARIEGRLVPDTSWEYSDPKKIEAARKMRLVQAYLSKGRKRARKLAKMNIDPNAQAV